MDIIWDFTLHLPGDVTFLKTMGFVMVFSMAVLIICLIARFLLGKDSGLKRCIVAALGILMLYGICVVIYTYSPRDFTHYLNQLPIGYFTTLDDGQKVLVLNTFRELPFPTLCGQVLRIFILALTINLLNGYTFPKVKGLGWLLWRVFSFVCAIGINYVIYRLIDMIAPFLLLDYVPMILLSILCFCFGMGVLNYFLVLLLVEVNPVFISLYGFFFAGKFGKQLSRAIGTTVIVIGFMLMVEKLGYGILPVSPADLSSYIPFAVSMFFLWLLTARKL